MKSLKAFIETSYGVLGGDYYLQSIVKDDFDLEDYMNMLKGYCPAASLWFQNFHTVNFQFIDIREKIRDQIYEEFE